jgi:acyl carrier protein
MKFDELLVRMQDLLQLVLDDDELEIKADTTADEVDGWDSLMHINIIVAAESEFGIKFSTAEIASTKSDGQNVGTFVKLLSEKMA